MTMLNDKCELLVARRAFVKNISMILASLLVPHVVFATTNQKNKNNEGGKNIPTTTAHVTEIRHWSNLDYTRIVLTLDRETRYEHHLLKQNSKTALSPHICIDIKGAGLSVGSAVSGSNSRRNFEGDWELYCEFEVMIIPYRMI